MGKFRNYVFAVAGFVILASAFTVIGPYVNQGQAEPPVKDVNIVNMPLQVEVQNGSSSNDYQFIGFSTDPIDGGQGMISMHGLCQADFGALARTCIGKEFWLSPNATAPGSDAWVHPSPDFFEVNQDSCINWTSNNMGNDGTVVSTAGKPSSATCNTPSPVTCCAPLQ